MLSCINFKAAEEHCSIGRLAVPEFLLVTFLKIYIIFL
ncbi:hypothetical protein l11_20390 [Neisseria weaveri LMG 5135]|nr:hypothetical protein l11_20390 [Neisseria weaveri LMG 5135]EGV35919.1 hypothetical protein l13_12590 [Neisseria weaveri ATCC 51223]